MTTNKATGLHFGATRVPAENSIAAIEKLLTKYRAVGVYKRLDPNTGRCLGIVAQLDVSGTPVPIKLDNRADRILARMKADHAARTAAAKKAPPPAPATPRDCILHAAIKAVSQRDNEAAYGTGNSFDAAARIKAAILSACHEPPPPAVEIAVTQIAVKLARLAGSGFKHEDSWVDFCGYGAWAYELATREGARQAQHLQAERATLQKMLEETSADKLIERIGLHSRIHEIDKALAPATKTDPKEPTP